MKKSWNCVFEFLWESCNDHFDLSCQPKNNLSFKLVPRDGVTRTSY